MTAKLRKLSKIFVVGDVELDPNRFNRVSYLALWNVSPLKVLAFNFRFNQVTIIFLKLYNKCVLQILFWKIRDMMQTDILN